MGWIATNDKTPHSFDTVEVVYRSGKELKYATGEYQWHRMNTDNMWIIYSNYGTQFPLPKNAVLYWKEQ